MPHTRPARGWGGTPRERDSRPRCTWSHGGVLDLCESPWPRRAGSGTLCAPSVDKRRGARRGRGDAGGADLCHHAAVSAAEAGARLRGARPGLLGRGRQRLWGASGAAGMGGGTRSRLWCGRLGESIALAGRSATPGHNLAGHAGAGGLAPMAGWRRDHRAPLVCLAVALPGRAAAAPLAPVALGAPESARPHGAHGVRRVCPAGDRAGHRGAGGRQPRAHGTVLCRGQRRRRPGAVCRAELDGMVSA